MREHESFSSYLRRRMEEAGIGPSELARRMGIRAHTVSRWRSGERTPTVGEASDLAEILLVEPAEVLERAGHEREAERRRAGDLQLGDPLHALKRDVARLPTRLAARGALIKLAEELSKTSDDDCRTRFDQAWALVNQSYGDWEPVSPAAMIQRIEAELRFHMFGETA